MRLHKLVDSESSGKAFWRSTNGDGAASIMLAGRLLRDLVCGGGADSDASFFSLEGRSKNRRKMSILSQSVELSVVKNEIPRSVCSCKSTTCTKRSSFVNMAIFM